MDSGRDIAAIIRECRARGLKLTDNLVRVVTALANVSGHPDAEELRGLILAAGHRIPMASVYRSLAQLVRVGVVEVRHFNPGMARYELSAKQPHGHLLDIGTGEVLEFHDPELDALEDRIAARLGYRILRRNVELRAIKISEQANVAGAGGMDASAGGPPGKISRQSTTGGALPPPFLQAAS